MHSAQRRQEFLLTLNNQLRSLEDPDAIMEATAKSLGRFLKVDCAGYGEVDEERGIILVEHEWSKGAIGNEGRAYRLYDFLPTMMAELKQGRPIFVEDITTDSREQSRRPDSLQHDQCPRGSGCAPAQELGADGCALHA
jgi:GAF domain-containing protein